MEKSVCIAGDYCRNVLETHTYRMQDSQKPYPPSSRLCIVFSHPDSFELILIYWVFSFGYGNIRMKNTY
jgi:hypothetical protein